jgi:glycosyltransferase involved in cell wall biosynthesis
LDPALAARTRVFSVTDDETLRKLYRTSALLLLPSRREGLPISLLEAMSCGCPALTAANSGMLDAIVPGENGWLEVSFDPEVWATRIVSLLAAPRALAAASEGAYRSAEQYRLDRITPKVAGWYAELLG